MALNFFSFSPWSHALILSDSLTADHCLNHQSFARSRSLTFKILSIFPLIGRRTLLVMAVHVSEIRNVRFWIECPFSIYLSIIFFFFLICAQFLIFFSFSFINNGETLPYQVCFLIHWHFQWTFSWLLGIIKRQFSFLHITRFEDFDFSEIFLYQRYCPGAKTQTPRITGSSEVTKISLPKNIPWKLISSNQVIWRREKSFLLTPPPPSPPKKKEKKKKKKKVQIKC